MDLHNNIDGLIPDGDMQSYSEVGAEIERRFCNPIDGELIIKEDGAVIEFDSPVMLNHIKVAEGE